VCSTARICMACIGVNVTATRCRAAYQPASAPQGEAEMLVVALA
jgi:hypothetical protein